MLFHYDTAAISSSSSSGGANTAVAVVVTARADESNNVVGIKQQPPPPPPHLPGSIPNVSDCSLQSSLSSNQKISLMIGSYNTSTFNLLLVLDIVSVPRHGNLLLVNNNTNTTLHQVVVTMNPYNHRFPIEIGQSMAALTYELSIDTTNDVENNSYSNNTIPSMNHDNYNNNSTYTTPNNDSTNRLMMESFDFRIRAYSFSNHSMIFGYSSSSTQPPPSSLSYQLVAISKIVTQNIHVAYSCNTQHHRPGTSLIVVEPNPPNILADYIPEAVTTTATTTTTINIEAMIVSPIRYLDHRNDDSDFDYIAYVRVDLWVQDDGSENGNGVLSLHDDGRHLANFKDCQNRTITNGNKTNTGSDTDNTTTSTAASSILWNCHGTGIQDRNMTFIAIPSNIEIILRYLLYEQKHAVVPMNDDPNPNTTKYPSIYIRVSDGTTGMCLTTSEQNQLRKENHRNSGNTMPLPSEPQLWYTDATTTTTMNGAENCYQTMAIIHIPIFNSSTASAGMSDPNTYLLYPNDGNRRPFENNNDDGFVLDFLTVADVLFWACICMVIVCGTVGYKKAIHSWARGGTIDIEVTSSTRSSNNSDDDCLNRYNQNQNNFRHDSDDDDHFSISTVVTSNVVRTTPSWDTQQQEQKYHSNEVWFRNAMAPPSDAGSAIFEAI